MNLDFAYSERSSACLRLLTISLFAAAQVKNEEELLQIAGHQATFAATTSEPLKLQMLLPGTALCSMKPSKTMLQSRMAQK